MCIWRNRAVIQYHAMSSHSKSCLTLQIDKVLAVEKDNAGFWTAVGQASVRHATTGTDAAVFCHQHFAELSIN